jgi:transcriptional repressor NrdR
MFCPFCQAQDTKVIDSRQVADGTQVRRRRECETCQGRFTTFENADLALPRVIKSDGERQPFNGSKLKAGMQRALEKRPLSTEDIDALFSKIINNIRQMGEREIPSRTIGEVVMTALKNVIKLPMLDLLLSIETFKTSKNLRKKFHPCLQKKLQKKVRSE